MTELLASLGAVAVVLRYALPVAWAALGETVGQRAGIINIGIEGVMLTSAFFGVLVAHESGSFWIGLAAGLGSGLLLSLIQAVFTQVVNADQVVVGMAVNLLALGVTGVLFERRFGGSGQLLSVPQVPRTESGWDFLMLALLLAIPLTTWALFKTRWGLALRACGEKPEAVEAAGFSVLGMRLQAALIGGLLASLGGVYLSLGISGSFAENMTSGRGFVAIAMVTFGQWRPIWVFGASLLIGLAEMLQFRLQAQGLGLPEELFIALPYILALGVLITVGKGAVAPAALAQPFRRQR